MKKKIKAQLPLNQTLKDELKKSILKKYKKP
jgi:hypothetical protein